MPVKSLQDLFVEELRDIYHAEKQITRALPKMAKAATTPELKQAFPPTALSGTASASAKSAAAARGPA